TLAAIELDAPRIDAVLTRDGRLNLADLLDSLPRSEPSPQPSAPRHVLLQHAVVRRGVLSFTDLSTRTSQTARVEPIDVELRGTSRSSSTGDSRAWATPRSGARTRATSTESSRRSVST